MCVSLPRVVNFSGPERPGNQATLRPLPLSSRGAGLGVFLPSQLRDSRAAVPRASLGPAPKSHQDHVPSGHSPKSHLSQVGYHTALACCCLSSVTGQAVLGEADLIAPPSPLTERRCGLKDLVLVSVGSHSCTAWRQGQAFGALHTLHERPPPPPPAPPWLAEAGAVLGPGTTSVIGWWSVIMNQPVPLSLPRPSSSPAQPPHLQNWRE